MSKSLFLRFFKKAMFSPLASQPILYQLLNKDRIERETFLIPLPYRIS